MQEKVKRGDHVWVSLQYCSFMAADILHLAAHQLQQPQANRLAAMQLAAAGQRLVAACADVLLQQADRLMVSPLFGGSSADRSSEEVELGMAATSVAVLQQGLQHLAPVLGGSGGPRATTSGARESQAAWLADTLAEINGIFKGSGLVADNRASQLNTAAVDIKHACGTGLQLVGCSNRACTNLSGPSAEGLVAGRKGVRCGGCRVARYCSPACQQEDWAQHRRVCRRLAAAGVQGAGTRQGAAAL
jgi:hypothetical protein